MRRETRFKAERAGFEPSTHLSARTRFPVALLRPLGHLSEALSVAAPEARFRYARPRPMAAPEARATVSDRGKATISATRLVAFGLAAAVALLAGCGSGGGSHEPPRA